MVSQPSAPNPYATAAAQTQQNQSASQYNTASGNVNEVTPYGTTSYNTIEQVPIYTNGQVTGYAPRYQKTTTLSPDQQKLLGLETQSKYNMGTVGVEQSAQLRDALSKPFSTDSLNLQNWGQTPAAQQYRQDQGATDRDKIEAAMMASYDRAVRPAEQQQESMLAARGLSPGSMGYGNYQSRRDDARAEAARQAYLASGAESRAAQAAYNDVNAQRFNQDSSIASYQNNLRQAQLQEALTKRNQPINEITALMSGSQATIPQFQPFSASPINPSNIGQYISDNYKAQSNAASTTNAGIFNLLGGAMKMAPGFG